MKFRHPSLMMRVRMNPKVMRIVERERIQLNPQVLPL